MRAALPLLCALLVAAGPAAATARAAEAGEQPAPTPVIGIGEQNPKIFTSRHFKALGIRHVRVVAPWDALTVYWQLLDLDAYMEAARKARARVLLGFGHSRRPGQRKALPSLAEFRRQFKAFRARYPWVRDYLTWNEANHCGEPLCNKPGRAAAYYRIIRANCPGCKIVAADVLDTPRMPGWVHAFRRKAGPGKLIWGLHNYIDANRFRTTGTEALLRAAPRGEIWFTETGGLVVRRNGSNIAFPGNKRHAAAATRHVFKLAALSPRVRRIYFYHWMPPGTRLPTWDSALVDGLGRPRPAYGVLRAWIERLDLRRARLGG